MKVISFDDVVAAHVTPEQCLAWTEEALRHKDEFLLPPKISLKPAGMDGVFYNTMPSVLGPLGYAGVKLVTRYPGRTPALDSQLMLYRLADGEMLALMDATWITNARTGAVAAHTAALLGVPGFTRVGIMGLGNTARATMECLRAAVPDRELEVGLLSYKDHAARFEERFSDMEGVTFHEESDPAELARTSQVLISCVTVAESDFCDDDCFAPGVLVIPVHTRGFTGCDLTFDRVFCDDVGHVKGFKNFAAFEPRLTEVSQVLTGKRPGRLSDSERILAYNIGISVHDIVFAARIYEQLAPSLPDVAFSGPTEKFWA